MRQFSFPHDNIFDEEEERSRLFFINNRSETENSIMQRFQSSILKVPKLKGVYAQFPAIQSQFNSPYVNDVIKAQQKTILFTPAPPIIRNESQKAIWKIVKKFANKYEYLWVLIAKMDDDKLNQTFTDIFKQQKLSNVNQNLENMLAPEDFQRVKMFTKQGLDVKIMMDYYSYQKYVSKDIKNLQKNNRVLEIFVQSEKITKKGVMGTKKIKNVLSLVQFLENEVKPDIEKSRKDKPYFNFIHSNSTPELFSRRSIIKNCISSKYQTQLQQNQKNFLVLLRKYNDDQRDLKIKQLTKLNLQQTQMITKINEINQRHRNFEQKNAKFESSFNKILTLWYPIQKQPEQARKQIYDWVITQYSIQSAIYPVVNNTIRFTNSTEKVRPLSTFIKYLFDAIRYYFTTRFRAINYNVVYRGSRISLVQQRSFVQGRYMWNLGFMSTSRSKKVAEGFLAAYSHSVQTQQKVLIIIQLPRLTNSIQYLWNQQGFYSLDYIPDISKYIIKDEQQVLFNPLNVFKIIKWDSESRLLVLKYSPHLQILEKKKQGIPINIQQQQLLRSISKLQDVSYDKGQQLLEQGDPGGAIKYYEQSNESGSNLSFSQKSNYIQGLREVCNLQKMEILIKDSLDQEKDAQKQLLSTQSTSTKAYIVDKLADSVQSLTLFGQTSNFQIADERAQFAKNTSSKISQKFTITQQILLLQTKTYIQLSKIKFGISETFQSIKQGIRSLKIIDQLANINLSFRLWQIGKDLRQIKNMVIKDDMKCIKKILSHETFYKLDIQQEKIKSLLKIQEVRKWNIQSEGSSHNNKNSQIIRGSTSTKNDHKTAERILEEYFKSRDTRTQAQKLQQMFVLAYWQSDRIKIQRESTEIEQIQSRQKLKLCQQKLFQVKKDYRDLFQQQVQAYEVLYRNIYKTSINVEHCLESYHKNVFRRYRQFIQIQCKYEGQSVQKAKVLWKYAQILFQYGQIIQRPKMKDKSHQTQAQREGDQLIKGSEAVINRIQLKQSRITGNKQPYTYEKSQIRLAITRYFKKKAIDKDEARKLSVVKNQNQYTHSSLSQTSSQQKNISFAQIIKALNENKQLIQSDSSIDKPMYKIKNSIQKIQVMNQSSHILIGHQSYIDRLKQCRNQFDDVLSTIQKYKQKQLMQRNINMSHLYLLMAENQFRLGLIMSAKNFLKQSDQCIKKALKLQTKEDDKKLRRLNRQKLILGNNTHIGCLRLQSHIVAFYGNAQQQKSLIETLRAKKQTMFTIMHQPLNQADINQSIGIIAVNLILKYRELKFQDAASHLTAAIKIRQKLLGPYNKLNARNYTFLIQLISMPQIFQQHYPQIEQYYKIASQIYNRMDFSSDSMLIIFRMQLQSTFLMFSYRQNQASSKIIQNLNQLHQCDNMHLSLEASQQLYRCSFYLSKQAAHQTQGLKWLKLTYKYTSNLQKMVTKTYSLQDGDLRRYHLTKLKVKILQSITQLEIKNKGTQINKYCHKYKDMKQKLQILKNNKGILSEVSSKSDK